MIIMACVQGWLAIRKLFGTNRKCDNNVNERITIK